MTTDAAQVLGIFDIAMGGLLSAVQESLSDLRNTNQGAVLVTNGALGEMTAQVDSYASTQKYMGVALANAAKDKLVGLLAQRLKGDGIYVGQVTIAGTIKGTPWQSPNSMMPLLSQTNSGSFARLAGRCGPGSPNHVRPSIGS